jgi:hypothetical protein
MDPWLEYCLAALPPRLRDAVVARYDRAANKAVFLNALEMKLNLPPYREPAPETSDPGDMQAADTGKN